MAPSRGARCPPLRAARDQVLRGLRPGVEEGDRAGEEGDGAVEADNLEEEDGAEGGVDQLNPTSSSASSARRVSSRAARD
jgi:hypothetical protein